MNAYVISANNALLILTDANAETELSLPDSCTFGHFMVESKPMRNALIIHISRCQKLSGNAPCLVTGKLLSEKDFRSCDRLIL